MVVPAPLGDGVASAGAATEHKTTNFEVEPSLAELHEEANKLKKIILADLPGSPSARSMQSALAKAQADSIVTAAVRHSAPVLAPGLYPTSPISPAVEAPSEQASPDRLELPASAGAGEMKNEHVANVLPADALPTLEVVQADS